MQSIVKRRFVVSSLRENCKKINAVNNYIIKCAFISGTEASKYHSTNPHRFINVSSV